MFTWVTFENHWHLLLRDCSERREKERQKLTTQKTFKKAYCPSNKESVPNETSRYVIFEIQEIGWDLSSRKKNTI